MELTKLSIQHTRSFLGWVLYISNWLLSKSVHLYISELSKRQDFKRQMTPSNWNDDKWNNKYEGPIIQNHYS